MTARSHVICLVAPLETHHLGAVHSAARAATEQHGVATLVAAVDLRGAATAADRAAARALGVPTVLVPRDRALRAVEPAPQRTLRSATALAFGRLAARIVGHAAQSRRTEGAARAQWDHHAHWDHPGRQDHRVEGIRP